LLVAVVPLQRDLRRLLAFTVVAHVAEVDGRRVERVLGAVQVLDEAGDAALVAELGGAAAALVLDLDEHAAVQERLLAHPLRQGVVVELEDGEDLRVGSEADLGAGAVALADRLDRLLWDAAVVDLVPDL